MVNTSMHGCVLPHSLTLPPACISLKDYRRDCAPIRMVMEMLFAPSHPNMGQRVDGRGRVFWGRRGYT